MQVIIIVECSKESKSDWVYINSLLKFKYDITSHKLSPIYLNGKGRYKNVSKKVEKLKKEYDDKTIVVMCIDLDSITNNPTDRKINDELYKYACSNNYYFVWFNRDIEEVFLNKRVNKSDKTKQAIDFLRTNKIEKIKFDNLNKENIISNQTSNIMFVFDKIFNKK